MIGGDGTLHSVSTNTLTGKLQEKTYFGLMFESSHACFLIRITFEEYRYGNSKIVQLTGPYTDI